MLKYEELAKMRPEYLRADCKYILDRISADEAPDEIDPDIRIAVDAWQAEMDETLDETTYLIEAQGLIQYLDDLDEEDTFGTEGWRARYDRL